MPAYRLEAIATLARQMHFASVETRAHQTDAAEQFLLSLDPLKAYPLELVIFRITGYGPRGFQPDLLTGLALQHDLGIMVEQVSQTLDVRVEGHPQPVLSIDDVSEKFGVTSKTVQRWRRRGLAARRFIFPDGKRRVGFLLSSVERFVRQAGDATAASTLPDESRLTDLLRNARRLATRCGCDETEIARRLAVRTGISPLAVLHTLRKHDREHPDQSVLGGTAPPLTESQRNRVAKAFRRGVPVRRIRRRFGFSRSAIYRAVIDERLSRLHRRRSRFIDDPLYHSADAAAAIDAIVSAEPIPAAIVPTEQRTPIDLPPFLRDLYRTPLLTASRERALFLKFNFQRWQFAAARRRLESHRVRRRDLDTLEGFSHQATTAKNAIVQANLRLVVSVARKHVRPGISLMELISEGNLTLIRAVEGFDLHRGYRFSTYATLALMKGFARSVPSMLAAQLHCSDKDMLAAVPDTRLHIAADRALDRDHVQQLLSRLETDERRVVLERYGLEGATPATCEQVATTLGISKQRVRTLERTAIEKLREGSARN